jgi:RNA polymerase sigma-70 factor (ECF subfamily)
MDSRERLAALDSARRGDGEALGRLLESFRPYVRVVIRGLGCERAAARAGESDFIQDALLEAHRSFPSFCGGTVAELVAWLRQIVVRTTARTLRGQLETVKRDPSREAPLDSLDGVADANQPTPGEQAARHEEAVSMADALGRLPDDMQQVLLGRHVDGLSHAELAARLGRSEGAVRVLYLRALRRLREVYRGETP